MIIFDVHRSTHWQHIDTAGSKKWSLLFLRIQRLVLLYYFTNINTILNTCKRSSFDYTLFLNCYRIYHLKIILNLSLSFLKGNVHLCLRVKHFFSVFKFIFINIPILAVVISELVLIPLYEVIASLFGPSLVLVYPFIEGRWGFLSSKLAVNSECHKKLLKRRLTRGRKQKGRRKKRSKEGRGKKKGGKNGEANIH